MTSEKENDWNMSNATMKRLHENMQRCHASRYQTNYEAWVRSLESIEIELQGILPGNEKVIGARQTIQQVDENLSKNTLNKDNKNIKENLDEATRELFQAMGQNGLLVKQRETTSIAGEN